MPPLFKCFYAKGKNDGEKGEKKKKEEFILHPPYASLISTKHYQCATLKMTYGNVKKLIDIPFPLTVTHA